MSDLFKARFEKYTRDLLVGYRLEEEIIKSFMENMVYIGFGVEQVVRKSAPMLFEFFSKNKEFTKLFITKLKEINKESDNLFSIGENDKYYYISCNRRSLHVDSLVVHKGQFKNSVEYFKKNKQDYQFKAISYDFVRDEVYAENEELFQYRIENFNKHEDDEFMKFWNEISQNDSNNEMGGCDKFFLKR